jgi:hypothetical protein
MQGKPVGTILAFVCLLVAFVAVPGAPSATEPGTEDAVALAISHVKENAAALGVGSADVADLAVTSAYRSRHNGVTHVNLNQRYRDRRRRARAGQLGDPGHREPHGHRCAPVLVQPDCSPPSRPSPRSATRPRPRHRQPAHRQRDRDPSRGRRSRPPPPTRPASTRIRPRARWGTRRDGLRDWM